MFSDYGLIVDWIPIFKSSYLNRLSQKVLSLTNKKDIVQKHSDKELVDSISNFSGIFFGGGNQLNLVDSLVLENGDDSPLLFKIRESYEKGLVIAGTSAGTVFQSGKNMITGDKTYYSNGGFGLFPYGLLDTHFSKRGREKRLIALSRKTRTSTAFGIDENTALEVISNIDDSKTVMTVLGEKQVHIYTNITSKSFEAQHLKKGEKYTLKF